MLVTTETINNIEDKMACERASLLSLFLSLGFCPWGCLSLGLSPCGLLSAMTMVCKNKISTLKASIPK